MLANSLTEDSHLTSSHILRLGNNSQTDNCSTSLNRNMVLVTFAGCFFEIKAIFGKMCMPSIFCLLYNRKMIIQNKFCQ